MSEFNLTIRTSSAAFHIESNDEGNGTHAPETEVVRLLREAADKIERGYGTVHRASLIDYNGNNVGSFEFTKEG